MGSLSPTRDFNYVKDTVEGFIALAESDRAIGEEVNIATGKEYTIKQTAEFLIAELNPLAQLIVEDDRLRPEKSEVFRLIGDASKLKSFTTWSPQYDLEPGLRETIKWFKLPNNLSRYKAWQYNI